MSPYYLDRILQNFNSIKVRLKQLPSFPADNDLSYFNSIKVRLKHIGCVALQVVTVFQFHKGTIKTFLFSSIFRKITHFNSIKVRLKRSPSTTNTANHYFNSIKVRLKLAQHIR